MASMQNEHNQPVGAVNRHTPPPQNLDVTENPVESQTDLTSPQPEVDVTPSEWKTNKKMYIRFIENYDLAIVKYVKCYSSYVALHGKNQ